MLYGELKYIDYKYGKIWFKSAKDMDIELAKEIANGMAFCNNDSWADFFLEYNQTTREFNMSICIHDARFYMEDYTVSEMSFDYKPTEREKTALYAEMTRVLGQSPDTFWRPEGLMLADYNFDLEYLVDCEDGDFYIKGKASPALIPRELYDYNPDVWYVLDAFITITKNGNVRFSLHLIDNDKDEPLLDFLFRATLDETEMIIKEAERLFHCSLAEYRREHTK